MILDILAIITGFWLYFLIFRWLYRFTKKTIAYYKDFQKYEKLNVNEEDTEKI